MKKDITNLAIAKKVWPFCIPRKTMCPFCPQEQYGHIVFCGMSFLPRLLSMVNYHKNVMKKNIIIGFKN